MSALLAGACCRPAEHPLSPSPEPTADALAAARVEVYRRRSERFPTAALLRPDSETDLPRPLIYLSPLILQGPTDPSAAAPEFDRFGAIRRADREPPSVDAEQRTVYCFSTQARLQGHEHSQWTFVWFYPPVPDSRCLRWRGFRMTLNRDGFPIVWEVAEDAATLQVLFVSSSLAADAQRMHGSPLSGRHYAVEPSVADQPRVVVAGLLGDGPAPMGPYVYLDGHGLNVLALWCRCSRSQVDRWFVDLLYQLVRIRDLAELQLGDQLEPHLGLSPDPAWLDQALRLPPLAKEP